MVSYLTGEEKIIGTCINKSYLIKSGTDPILDYPESFIEYYLLSIKPIF